MITFIFWTVLLGIVIAVLVIEWKRINLSRKYKHISGVPEVPIIGSTFIIRLNDIKELDIVFKVLQTAPVSKFFVLHRVAFFVSDPVVLQQIFNGSNFCEHPYVFDMFRVPYGIITAHYNIWKPIRKAITPSLSQRMSMSFIPIFQKHFIRFCDDINHHVDGATFDIHEFSLKTNIAITLETNFDLEMTDRQIPPHLFEDYMDNVCQRIILSPLHLDMFYKFSNLAKEDKVVMDQICEIFETIARDRMSHIKKSGNEESVENNNVGWRRIFIDEILRHSRSYTDENIQKRVLIQNCFTIFMAAFDTTALTVSNIILMLAMHPEVDQKVAKELAENYHIGNEINQELFKRLPYLDCVMKETLRLFPPAPVTMRTNMEDVVLDKIGHVQKGTIFALNFYNLHRWKHIWGEDADQFNPDRFLPENSADRHPYAFLPFSAGIRNCIGYQYGIITVKTGLINTLSRYKFTTDLTMDDLVFKISITMKLITKHLVRVQKR